MSVILTMDSGHVSCACSKYSERFWYGAHYGSPTIDRLVLFFETADGPIKRYLYMDRHFGLFK